MSEPNKSKCHGCRQMKPIIGWILFGYMPDHTPIDPFLSKTSPMSGFCESCFNDLCTAIIEVQQEMGSRN